MYVGLNYEYYEVGILGIDRISPTLIRTVIVRFPPVNMIRNQHIPAIGLIDGIHYVPHN